MNRKYTSILESIEKLDDESTKDLYTRLVELFDSKGKTTGREIILFIEKSGTMLSSLPLDLEESRKNVELKFYVNGLDELSLFSDEFSSSIDFKYASNKKLVIVIPPEFNDGKFVMTHNLKLTDKQNETINRLMTFGFKSIEMILPYE